MSLEYADEDEFKVLILWIIYIYVIHVILQKLMKYNLVMTQLDDFQSRWKYYIYKFLRWDY